MAAIDNCPVCFTDDINTTYIKCCYCDKCACVKCHKDYLTIIKRLIEEGVPLNITLIFTLVQSLFMCKLGVRYISPFIGRADDIGIDGSLVLHEIREMIDLYGFEKTKIIAASIRHVRHLHEAINAGSDIVTLPISLLETVLSHPLTDHGITKFLDDWKKLGITQFP